MHLHINPHDSAPVYRQIQHQIVQAIAEREIRPGDLLESQQELAAQLAVTPSAVRKAYQELQSAGLCDESRGGQYRVTIPGLGCEDGRITELALSLLRKELLTQELLTAREVQHRLLPPSEVRGDRFRVSSRSYPAGVLAGDFYDILEQQDGVVDLVIADVAGKGLAAGLVMAAAKSLIPLAASKESPGSALNELNIRLLAWLGDREFVALAYARLDLREGTLSLANAGLPDPYLMRHTGSVETLEVGGDRLPLGIREDVCYCATRISLDPHDRLLLITDGIPEAIEGVGRPLGYEGLARLLESSTGWDRDTETDPWLDRFLDRVSQRTGSMLDDDWTAMLLEYHPF